MPFACEMPLGLKLLVDQRLQPVCIEGFVRLRPQRRCPSGAERFAFQSRAGTGAYFTTGASARPLLPLSLRAGGAAGSGEGSAPCSEQFPVQPRETGPRGRAGSALCPPADAPRPMFPGCCSSPSRAPIQPEFAVKQWEEIVRAREVLVGPGGCREDGGGCPRAGCGWGMSP